MTEHSSQPDPYLSPEASAELAFEQTRQEDADRFKATLEPEQEQVFEEIFGPVGQLELERLHDETGSYSMTRFGLFPRDPSRIQSSIRALMDADTLEGAIVTLSEDSPVKKQYLSEAEALRNVAKDLAKQQN